MITTLDEAGKAFIKKEEGCILHAYQDRVGVWTIGYGNTYWPDGTPVKQGDIIVNTNQADSLFDRTVSQYEEIVEPLGLNQFQFNACCSLCWNIGTGGFHGSSLYKLISFSPNTPTTIEVADIAEDYIREQLIKDGRQDPIKIITYDFLKWSKDGGNFDIDLYRRRWREVFLYFNINQ